MIRYNIFEIDYVEGQKKSKKETFSSTINFSLKAYDKNQKEYSFDFIINIDNNMLNKLTKKAICINKHVISGEIFFHNPYEKKIEILSLPDENNIYEEKTGFYAAKLTDNIFVFKISYPDIFIWFHLNLIK